MVSRFEAEVLHIPPSLSFFTVGGAPDRLFREGFVFLLALLHAFVASPLLDSGSRNLRDCGKWYLRFLVIFWTTNAMVSSAQKRMRITLTE